MLRSLDFKLVCQRQAQQLVNLLALVSVWGVFRDADTQERNMIRAYQSDCSNCDSAIVSYLESEQWLETSLPVLQLILLPLNERKDVLAKNFKNSEEEAKFLDESQNFIYLFLGANRESSSSFTDSFADNFQQVNDYFLFWSATELSGKDRKTIEFYGQLLIDCLSVRQNYEMQRKKAKSLEQAIGKGEHQLRNSLALINLYAENLCAGLSSGILQEQAMVISQTATQLSENLHNLLYFGQQKALNIASQDLREILQETLELLSPKIENKQLKIEYPQQSVLLAVDKWQIKQVFENLLTNAIEFSPPGSRIVCNWQVFQEEILVEICDRGRGLSPQDLVEAFTPFYSRREGGTGLGLTIAKKAILDHNGSIWAENLLGGGALFSFTLPRNLNKGS
jgi:signal transduction histidine kinase